MKLARQLLISKILGDIRFILAMVAVTAIFSTVIAYGFGFRDGSDATYNRIMATLDGRD